jgi:probable rRNA maturation factor
MTADDQHRRRGGLERRREVLDVLVADQGGRRLRVRGLTAWLQRAAPSRLRGWVSIAIVSDARVRALNARYRGADHPTDVLSFPAHPTPPRADAKSFLGDIVIAKGVARRQARAAGHSELTELKVLALHGLLHLLGYDHEADQGRMRRVEGRLRRKGGLRAGLIERSAGPARPYAGAGRAARWKGSATGAPRR